MRFHTRLATTLLLSALPCFAQSAAPQVYLFGPSQRTSHQNPQELNVGEATEVLSQHLGFDIVHEMADRPGMSWEALSSAVHGKGGAGVGVGEGAQDSVLMVIQSNHPEDFVPATVKPAFTIADAPSTNSFTDLLKGYTDLAHELFDTVVSSLHPLISSVKESNAFKHLLDIFDLSSGAAQLFVEEFDRLVKMLEEGAANVGGRFSSYEVKSLAQLEEDYGRKSEQYKTAVKAVEAVLSNPNVQNRQAAIIVVPPQHETYVPRKRSLEQEKMSTASNKVVFSVSTCFTSNQTCSESTSNCSGHGSCNAVTRAGKTCYTCSCAITKNDKGRRQWWAGQACERLDLSTPFTLLAGSAIFLIIVVIFAVSILQSVGSETLPSTLTAAAAPHTKRD